MRAEAANSQAGRRRVEHYRVIVPGHTAFREARLPFTFIQLKLPGLVLIDLQPFEDDRGFFMETYKRSVFAEAGLTDGFVQDNYSHSHRGVLRGLHYQKHPAAQAKLVSVLRGEILDVAVDIRLGSPTYGQWEAVGLSSDRPQLLYVPEGYAHGFCVTSKEADVLYKVNRQYSPEHERGIVWSDPDLAIDWPVERPVLSSRDASLPSFREADNNFQWEDPGHGGW